MRLGLFRNGNRTGVANAVISVFLVLCLSACVANSQHRETSETQQSNDKEKWSVHYVPMLEDHKTLYGVLFYDGNEANRKAGNAFAPWNITATEICFAYGAQDNEHKSVCQRLERYNREGVPPKLTMRQQADRLHKESFFSILIPRARSLRLKSVTLHGKDYSYVITFTSNPAVEMPDSKFIDFGALILDANPLPDKKEPEISFVGTVMLPFKPELKVTGANCAVVSYDIPYDIQRVPLQKPTE